MNGMPGMPKTHGLMSHKHVRLLMTVVGIEVAVIAGLLVWGLLINKPEPTPTLTPPAPQQTTKEELKPAKIELRLLVKGLDMPVDITAMPVGGDKRIFVAEQAGVIRVVGSDGTIEPKAFLNIKSRVMSGGEMGLLGLAFHPKAAENSFFFVNYIDKDQNTVIARYTYSKTTGLADPGSEKIILKISQPYKNHNGGQLKFGPDGYLYVGMGDGGSGGDPGNRAQNINNLLGKMLRINVDSGSTYAIPSDNPLTKEAGKKEVWALGLRNPWRFSFDRKTGDLFIADVGQGDYEEINFQASSSKGGENYGWRCYEGSHEFNTAGCGSKDNYTMPIIEYGHSEGRCSVTGGFVYRGDGYPAMDGMYFYGDYCGGQLYQAVQANGKWTVSLVAKTGLSISTFGQDNIGELYLADHQKGAIYQIIDVNNTL